MRTGIDVIHRLTQERERLFDPNSAAMILKVPSATVCSWISAGDIETVRWPDGSVYIHEYTLLRLMRPPSLCVMPQGEGWWDDE